MKYSETMAEPLAGLRPRYEELSRLAGIYKDPEAPALRGNPVQQLWREHMLSRAMIHNGLYSRHNCCRVSSQVRIGVSKRGFLVARAKPGETVGASEYNDKATLAIRVTQTTKTSSTLSSVRQCTTPKCSFLHCRNVVENRWRKNWFFSPRPLHQFKRINTGLASGHVSQDLFLFDDCADFPDGTGDLSGRGSCLPAALRHQRLPILRASLGN